MDLVGFLISGLPYLLLLMALLTLLYLYGSRNHNTWSRLGVPGPRPSLFLGNSRVFSKGVPMGSLTKWNKEHGRVYGIYLINSPLLVITDIDILKEILVKDFSNFTERFESIYGKVALVCRLKVAPTPTYSLSRSTQNSQFGEFLFKNARPTTVNKALFFLGGTAWKRIRSIMTPTFSASKLKNIFSHIVRCGRILTECLEAEACRNKSIDVKDLFGSFTMDVITGAAFSLETNSQTQKAETLFVNIKQFFLTASRFSKLFLLLSVSPFLRRIMPNAVFSKSSSIILRSVTDMVEDRKQNREAVSKKRTDLLQLLVDAEVAPEDWGQADPIGEDGTIKGHKGILREEIVGQGFIVLAAGYETTATTLQFISYNLALHQDSQQRVYEEIVDQLGEEPPTYENMTKLKYLDCVVRETLRLFPPLPQITRKALKTTTIKGITIPAGCGIVIPIYDIMHDPEYFDDPEAFRPERFLSESREGVQSMLASLPFGYGPRQCIGMRLALLEIKVALVHTLRAVRFLKCDDTPEKLVLKPSVQITMPNETIKLKAEVRSNVWNRTA